ncbi:hypothetical protein J1N35_027864 [Gossypium stocksii]|uniref:Uncharacterized protein n=1 Tax=Gossypium stocksii TaxID=47602 RepID=A0A9D3VCN0_9ROSI|nr:hypothetical protein J1N35_027864 [Gossypium stocksii]
MQEIKCGSINNWNWSIVAAGVGFVIQWQPPEEGWLKINTDGRVVVAVNILRLEGHPRFFGRRRGLYMKVSDSLGSAAIVMSSWRAITGVHYCRVCCGW